MIVNFCNFSSCVDCFCNFLNYNRKLIISGFRGFCFVDFWSHGIFLPWVSIDFKIKINFEKWIVHKKKRIEKWNCYGSHRYSPYITYYKLYKVSVAPITIPLTFHRGLSESRQSSKTRKHQVDLSGSHKGNEEDMYKRRNSFHYSAEVVESVDLKGQVTSSVSVEWK